MDGSHMALSTFSSRTSLQLYRHDAPSDGCQMIWAHALRSGPSDAQVLEFLMGGQPDVKRYSCLRLCRIDAIGAEPYGLMALAAYGPPTAIAEGTAWMRSLGLDVSDIAAEDPA